MAIAPKTIQINGQDVREQTLDEFIAALPTDHCVKLQVAELRREVEGLALEMKQILSERAALTEQIGELENLLAKAKLQVKIQTHAIRKRHNEKQAVLAAEINPPRPPEGL
jgi:chorismate mutase